MKPDLEKLILALLQALLEAKAEQATPTTIVAPGATQTTTATTSEKPDVVWPVSLKMELDLFLGGADHPTCPYRLEEQEDYYEIIKTDGTTNLPIHGGAYLHAGYVGPDGKGIWFEPGSPLDHTAIWTARRVPDSKESVFCGPGNPAYEGGSREVANFWLREYERTRGMDVQVKFPPTANDTVVEIQLRVNTPTGPIFHKPVRFPKVS